MFNFVLTFSCNEGGAKGSHNACNIRTDRCSFRDSFKTAQDSIVVEGSTLYDDLFTKRSRICQFDYL